MSSSARCCHPQHQPVHRESGTQRRSSILEPLASSASVLSAEEQEAGVALVDMGIGTTDIAIFQDGIIRHTAVIPFGGNVLTEDIRQGCQIMKKQAELLKQRFGSAIATEMKDNEIVCIPVCRDATHAKSAEKPREHHRGAHDRNHRARAFRSATPASLIS